MVRTKVFVGNLSFTTKEPELAAEFEAAGKVISANIITRGPRSLGYGFVEMESEEAAQNAVKLMDKKDFQGRQINVEVARPQEENKQPKEPRKVVQDQEGQSSENRRPRRPKNYRKKEDGSSPSQQQSSGQRKTETSHQAKPTVDGEGGQPPRNNRRNRKHENEGTDAPRRVPNENREESKTTLFVANLPFSLDDDGFAKVVTDLGLKLKAAHVVKKRNLRSKGYGFVEFDTHEDQQKALNAVNKKVVDGRELSVKVALTESKTENGKEEEERKETKPTSPPTKEAKPPTATKETKQASPVTTPVVKEVKTPPTAAKETKAPTTPTTVVKDTKPPTAVKETKPTTKESKTPEQKESPKVEAKSPVKEVKPTPKKEEKTEEKK